MNRNQRKAPVEPKPAEAPVEPKPAEAPKVEPKAEAPKPAPAQPAEQLPEFVALGFEDARAQLRAKGIASDNSIVKGNGTLAYTDNGVKYQIHYENGKPTAIRVKDADLKKYYGFDKDGKTVEISRDDFLKLKDSSALARAKEIQLLNLPETVAKPNSVQEVRNYLKSQNIEPTANTVVDGNGAIQYKENGTVYQIHYENGNPTAVRVEIDGKKTYYKYENGKPVEINRDNFIELKNASDAAQSRSMQARMESYEEASKFWNSYRNKSVDFAVKDLEAKGYTQNGAMIGSANKLLYKKGNQQIILTLDANGRTVQSIDVRTVHA